MAKKAGLIWIDAQGERVLNVVTTQSGVGGIEAALEAASNAVVMECWEGLDEIYSASPTTSEYPTVRVMAVLNFIDGTGSRARLYIPSPQSGIFLSDARTVDPTNALIAAIITAAVGSLLSGAGNTVTAFTGGEILATKISGIASIE